MATKHHGLMSFKGLDHLCRFGPFRTGRFARLFPDLPPLYINPLDLHELGKAGGKMEDKGTPKLTKKVPAGLVFFGQFIDHDITLDDSSSLSASNDPEGTENVRTPTLDLDCIYGDGPEAHPYLYDGDGKLLTGKDYPAGMLPNWRHQDDLARTPHGTAIIGDPRNDENRVISQMQLGVIRFHNSIVDLLKAQPDPLEGAELFEKAREIATWHYQWIVINDFLRAMCGDWIVDNVLAYGRKVYQPECMGVTEPFIPIEFATAAYRFGHTMIPQKLRVKPGNAQHAVFGGTFGLGFQPVTAAAEVVNWAALLDSGNGQYERAGQMDAKLAKALLDLPFMDPALPAPLRSLAVRNLLRAQSFLIPSGEEVAAEMIACGAEEITPAMIDSVRSAVAQLGFKKASPLWLYILAEGKVVGRLGETQQGQQKFEKGEGLGPVGARLVAEVIIGLLELDHRSFMGSNRNWSPEDEAALFGGTAVTTLYGLLTL